MATEAAWAEVEGLGAVLMAENLVAGGVAMWAALAGMAVTVMETMVEEPMAATTAVVEVVQRATVRVEGQVVATQAGAEAVGKGEEVQWAARSAQRQNEDHQRPKDRASCQQSRE